MKRYYLAYGSNLNLTQMRWRCPDARVLGTAEIADYRLLFKGSKTGSYLTIEPFAGGKVPVAVWEVSIADEERLDRYEGYLPHLRQQLHRPSGTFQNRRRNVDLSGLRHAPGP